VLKRLKQFVIGGAALAALAFGSSATAGAATDRSSGSSSTMATLQGSGSGSGSGSGGAGASFTAAPASAASAHASTEKTLTADAADKATAAPLVNGRGGSIGAMHHVRDGWIHDQYLTDHEEYLRHHARLASRP
jgi:hypothetical protein